MASHGVPRVTNVEPRTEAAVHRELEQIGKYKTDVEALRERIESLDFSKETFDLCTRILNLNPEFYTVWNHRRRILLEQWTSEPDAKDQIPSQIVSELKFLTSLMLKYPKCYWIWNYRLWILDQAITLLEVSEARSIWNAELALVSKMLSRDGRNFHGWRYRRMVVSALESERLSPGSSKSLAQEELDYTSKMVNTNLSNFSAWHNRSRLILRILDEKQSSNVERQMFLDKELDLSHNSLIDPYDQSLWFYHAYLMSSFDPSQVSRSIAPNLSQQERQKYLEGEITYVLEILEDTMDCKWVYQTLIDLARLYKLNGGSWPPKITLQDILRWVDELQKLDPLRHGRWMDLKADLTDA